jgi:hypothetical protein
VAFGDGVRPRRILGQRAAAQHLVEVGHGTAD